jgi:anti-anti-sigma regulatory factor
MNGPDPQPSARVRIRHGLGDAKRPITLIEVEGEHDYEHRETLISALDEVDGHLVVDLTSGFVDKCVIAAILAKTHDLARHGHRLELVVLPSGPVSRTVDLLGLRDVVCVRDEPLDSGAADT